MTMIPDLTDVHGYLSIGWLGSTVPRYDQSRYWDAETPSFCIEALKYFSINDAEPLVPIGLHQCEVCHSYSDNGKFYVRHSGIAYVLPQMVFHYINDHEYRPPDKFLRALVAAYRLTPPGKALDRLREMVDQGDGIDDAIRSAHRVHGFNRMQMCNAVARIEQITLSDAVDLILGALRRGPS